MQANSHNLPATQILPTAEEWSEISKFTRVLIGMDDPETRRRKLEKLTEGNPRLARRLAQVLGVSCPA